MTVSSYSRLYCQNKEKLFLRESKALEIFLFKASKFFFFFPLLQMLNTTYLTDT